MLMLAGAVLFVVFAIGAIYFIHRRYFKQDEMNFEGRNRGAAYKAKNGALPRMSGSEMSAFDTVSSGEGGDGGGAGFNYASVFEDGNERSGLVQMSPPNSPGGGQGMCRQLLHI